MKVSIKQLKKSKIVIEIRKDLEKYEKINSFPEKLTEANETLSKGGLQKQIAKSDQTIKV